VAAAIKGELEKLAAADQGTRNHTLYVAACNVFEFVKGGHADEVASRAELKRIAGAIGLEDREIRATVDSAWQHVGPRDVLAPRGAA
jgi:predicted PhzF superfamily epimerase YddE/YHI9